MSARRRWVVPSLGFVLLLLHLAVTVCRPERPVADPGTGWHLKWGQIILDSGVVWGR